MGGKDPASSVGKIKKGGKDSMNAEEVKLNKEILKEISQKKKERMSKASNSLLRERTPPEKL